MIDIIYDDNINMMQFCLTLFCTNHAPDSLLLRCAAYITILHLCRKDYIPKELLIYRIKIPLFIHIHMV